MSHSGTLAGGDCRARHMNRVTGGQHSPICLRLQVVIGRLYVAASYRIVCPATELDGIRRKGKADICQSGCSGPSEALVSGVIVSAIRHGRSLPLLIME